MKKKLLALSLIAVMSLSFTACGGGNTNSSSKADTKAETEATTAAAEAAAEATNENEPKVEKSDGITKEIYYTNKELDIKGTTGTINYTIDQIQVSNVTFDNDDIASAAEMKKGDKGALVAIHMTVENTSDDTTYFYADQANMVTDTKEKTTPNVWFSDSMDGEYNGKIKNEGTLMYFFKNSDAKDIKSVKYTADAPSNENFEPNGNEVVEEISLQ